MPDLERNPERETDGAAERRRPGLRMGRPGSRGIWPVLVFVLVAGILWCVGCSKGDDTGTSGSTSSTTSVGRQSGDVQGQVGKALTVGVVQITLNALEATLNPSLPSQKMSDQPPVAPGATDSFYQAFLRIENLGDTPVRVDGNDFSCLVGSSICVIDATRSGPEPRSLLRHASLDMLLTFKGPAGYEPVLVYRPPWYDGVIRMSRPAETTTTST